MQWTLALDQNTSQTDHIPREMNWREAKKKLGRFDYRQMSKSFERLHRPNTTETMLLQNNR